MPRKREKAQMNYELKTNGHETTTEKAIGIIPESLKHIDTHPIHETRNRLSCNGKTAL